MAAASALSLGTWCASQMAKVARRSSPIVCACWSLVGMVGKMNERREMRNAKCEMRNAKCEMGLGRPVLASRGPFRISHFVLRLFASERHHGVHPGRAG